MKTISGRIINRAYNMQDPNQPEFVKALNHKTIEFDFAELEMKLLLIMLLQTYEGL